jgi:hypothetical protein
MKIRKSWLIVGICFAENPSAKQNCPDCIEGVLKCRDIPLDEKGKKERIIYCENCDRYEAILLNRSVI